MSFEKELRRYLERGMTLQHRRLEWIRSLKNGELYQRHLEDRVKWRQDVPCKVHSGAPMLPATWEILPNTSWDG